MFLSIFDRAWVFRTGLLLMAGTGLAGCKEQNKYVPPPPPKVSVATPIRQEVTDYLEVNGSVEAVNTVDLVARVQGFLQEIAYNDGETVKGGRNLFTIEPPPYLAKLNQAKAQEQSTQAQLKQAQDEYTRQSTLGRSDFASQSIVEQALAKRDALAANLLDAQANTQVAAINYSYTHVLAPFDGVVTAHIPSIGALVGGTTPTKLATIIQIDPIHVTFTISEQDVQRIRAAMAKAGITIAELGKIPVEVGLQTEQGYPHTGTIDYFAPQVDPSTGTLLGRGLFVNAEHILLPGFFTRVRVPLGKQPNALLVPDTALGADQGGRYVLVVNKDNVVEQRHVEVGALVDTMRVIDKGITADDRVVVDGIQRAIPGAKVDPTVQTAAAAPTNAAKN
ncbi:MAG: efflux RND transporter periplasmic adaptor subunit [Acetobacteraceae bacterium]|nr:efflux RND transporter periplasmic adaptor subunit [Acetobacteraceae bacterium]